MKAFRCRLVFNENVMAEKKDAKKQVRQELGFLLNNGVKVTIEEVRYERRRPWRKPEEIRETHVYEIQQPTLGVLDLINHYVGDIDIDEDVITKSANPYPELRRLSRKYVCNVSQAMAVAILGRRSFVKRGGEYRVDYRAINRLSAMLMENVTPSKLMEMVQALSVMCNLSDFLNSIRLLQIAPDRIEPTEAD